MGGAYWTYNMTKVSVSICSNNLPSHLAMSYGLLCLAMAYLAHLMGDSVLQVTITNAKSNNQINLH